MLSQQTLLKPSTAEAVGVMIFIIALMSICIVGLEWVPHLAIFAALLALMLYGLVRKVAWDTMLSRMASAVEQGMGAIYLFFFIGVMISALMMSGAVPTLMYYGFNWISPDYFYLSAFALCSLVGVCIGSSLTTCATIGVAFMGMAGAFGADTAMTAGAIVSGAFFGDKMSPLSDTTSIAAATVGVDLFEHIRNMAFTTIPALILSALVYLFLPDVSASIQGADLSSLNSLREALAQSGLVHSYSLIPFVLLLILALCRVNAFISMLIVIASSVLISYFQAAPSVAQIGNWFFSGYKNPMLPENISRLVSRGGMESMFFTQTVVILALSLGGLLFALGIVPVLLATMRHLLINAGRATACVAATSLGVNLLIGEQYLSILLAGETFKPVYDKLQLHPRNLSRTLEDAGTVINPLVPWSVCGVFIAKVLEVSVLAYIPYAIFCYACLLLTLLFGFTGLTLSNKQPEKETA